MLKEVYIVNAVRTPIGSFGGVFTSLTATQLGGQVIKSLVDQSTLPAEAIDEVLFGNVCSANLGQAPARQAALYGGLPFEVSCTTINKVCASGMKALMFGPAPLPLRPHPRRRPGRLGRGPQRPVAAGLPGQGGFREAG